MINEIKTLSSAAKEAKRRTKGDFGQSQPQYVLSVGATPTATSVENINHSNLKLLDKAQRLIDSVRSDFVIELHAGVYPILDMQQLATHASPSAAPGRPTGPDAKITTADLALTILTEVTSTYDERCNSSGGHVPEALIAVGTLALGHDVAKSYSGWGIVSDWGMEFAYGGKQNVEGRSGWQVGRISQEHGVLTKDEMLYNLSMASLTVGQKVRIWPNHACIAGAGHGWYLVVDSSLPEERRDEIVDVWIRCRGW